MNTLETVVEIFKSICLALLRSILSISLTELTQQLCFRNIIDLLLFSNRTYLIRLYFILHNSLQ